MIISTLPIFLKNKTCAITGHRTVSDDFDTEKLKKDLTDIYEKGFSVFLVGMAKGFDTLCYKALIELKKKFDDIRICAVIPCSDQSKYFTSEEKEEYENLIGFADFVAKEEKSYFKGCMLIRNDYMLNNSSLLYAYYNQTGKGGTLYTIKGAKKRNITILYY